jgi:hypothetical protein
MIAHRAWRDITRCRAKYGEAWLEYERQVPYLFIPVSLLAPLTQREIGFFLTHLSVVRHLRTYCSCTEFHSLVHIKEYLSS